MGDRRSEQRAAHTNVPPPLDGQWYLVNPALERPRRLGERWNTVIKPEEERAAFAALPEEAQDALVEQTWSRVVDWAIAKGARTAVVETLGDDVNELQRLGFSLLRGRQFIGADWQLGTHIYQGTDLNGTLRQLAEFPTVTVLVCDPNEVIAVVYDASWWAIAVKSTSEPVALTVDP